MRIVITTLLALFLASTAAAATAAAPPAKVTVGAAAKKRPPVTFDHAKHATVFAKSCDSCHHTQKGLKKGDAKTEVRTCVSCHLDAKGKVPSMREMSMQKNPFHVRCLSCHKEQKKGPVACAGCHVKK